ncbi:pyrroline-5-carboxylate reductase [Saccharopolyspora antimicrobica]|uniref:Pyrroline-5-carboxylate reductase n=1 Tax=Saccharopolyspora antimicrobica TaxID=455193 RepID=A0A1I4YHM8_9PSEU|nr:NAD(P)-binding domain-containing protein [Saccharopolyspora antimicrobica]RKT82680.1 pyrroline-5-carboxylate reductase [Saccharopolyspora antimicrobica]SFN37541.1 pyrroline-5-carboxylate reductase [Saccharopolyspora antimicrobica]
MIECIGIIGTGSIAADIVDGLCTAPEPSPAIHLSPRNARIASALARRHPGVHVRADNQSVVDAAGLILLAVRPDAVREALTGLRVPDDRVLISAVAGWSIEALRAQLDSDVTVVRSIPLPAVRHQRGVTALHPAHPAAEEVFDRLGGALVVDDPTTFDALSAATATISTYLHYLDAVAGWIARQGMEPHAAEDYVRSMFSGVNAALADQSTGLSELGRAHETPGGNNEALRARWFDSQNRAALDEALEHIRRRVAASTSEWAR